MSAHCANGQACITSQEFEFPVNGDWSSVCLTPESTRAALAAQFVMNSGDCDIDGLCVTSHNWPEAYGHQHNCQIDIPAGSTAFVDSFATEAGFDFLTVNGQRYSGATFPAGVVAEGSLEWVSDGSIAHSGWRVCLQRLPVCDTEITFPGKGCPSSGACLNDNTAYSTLEEAWAQCDQVDGCGNILLWTNGNYYLRRDTDPDVSAGRTLSHCPGFSSVPEIRPECGSVRPEPVSPGKGCPPDDICLNDNTPYSTLNEAWAQCEHNIECGNILHWTNGNYYLRRDTDPDVAEGATTHFCHGNPFAPFVVNSGDCAIDGDCVTSPNIPEAYTHQHNCQIDIPAGSTAVVESFNT
jgi:hypothetical protein